MVVHTHNLRSGASLGYMVRLSLGAENQEPRVVHRAKVGTNFNPHLLFALSTKKAEGRNGHMENGQLDGKYKATSAL